MKFKITKTHIGLIGAVLLIILFIILGIIYYKTKHQKINNPNNGGGNSEQTATAEDETTDQGSTPNQSDSLNTNQSTTQPVPTTPQKPTFTKSSGNNGPIPQNVLVEFVCTALPGLDCQIILINSNGQKITLPYKPVTDNGRGQYFTSWQWTSMAGTWTINAQSKNTQGGVNSSEKQTLVVK